MHGVLNLDKPVGMTSRQAVSRVKKLLNVRKAGHAGTLDPMATGVLLVCLGEATKISSLLMGMTKTYEAELRLGQRTDTLDADGEIIEEQATGVFSVDDIKTALDKFIGVIRQTPPMYSAIKKDGRPLYELARKGVTVERNQREVNVYGLESLGYEHPYLGIRVSCSKGTYIRTLAEDIAEELGTLAHLSALRRTRVGDFMVEDACLPDEVPHGGAGLVSVDRALHEFTEVVLEEKDYARMRNGGFADSTKYGINCSGSTLRLKGPNGDLFAIGSARDGQIKVDRMLHLKGQT